MTFAKTRKSTAEVHVHLRIQRKQPRRPLLNVLLFAGLHCQLSDASLRSLNILK